MDEETRRKIYTLELNGIFTLDVGVRVRRVPGGWTFEYFESQFGEVTTAVFIPFNNEFQKVNNERSSK